MLKKHIALIIETYIHINDCKISIKHYSKWQNKKVQNKSTFIPVVPSKCIVYIYHQSWYWVKIHVHVTVFVKLFKDSLKMWYIYRQFPEPRFGPLWPVRRPREDRAVPIHSPHTLHAGLLSGHQGVRTGRRCSWES